MSGKPQITYTSREEASKKGELTSLGNVYGFIVQCAKNKKRDRSVTSGLDDTKARSDHDFRASSIIQKDQT